MYLKNGKREPFDRHKVTKAAPAAGQKKVIKITMKNYMSETEKESMSLKKEINTIKRHG